MPGTSRVNTIVVVVVGSRIEAYQFFINAHISSTNADGIFKTSVASWVKFSMETRPRIAFLKSVSRPAKIVDRAVVSSFVTSFNFSQCLLLSSEYKMLN